MNSEIIKFVAGAGKTTYSIDYLANNTGGLYLAFTKSVVGEIYNAGYLSKTIDSFFFSYIIPKFIRVIPTINNGSSVGYINKDEVSKKFLGIMNIHIDPETGNILNKQKTTGFSLETDRNILQKSSGKNSGYIKFIFSDKSLNLTDTLRNELSQYLLLHYSDYIIDFIRERFSFVIIDEAQDLGGYKEIFARLIDESDIKTIMLGDDNQNIMSGAGEWFGSRTPTRVQNKSKRSPEPICSWIRDNLGIEIYGNDQLVGKYHQIKIDTTQKYDDGKRHLLYNAKSGKIEKIVDSWKGPKSTIKTAKGMTIEQDIVIVGKQLSKKNLYTALTRTKQDAYSTVSIPNN